MKCCLWSCVVRKVGAILSSLGGEYAIKMPSIAYRVRLTGTAVAGSLRAWLCLDDRW